MDEAYALRYQDLYENHWWWQAREEFIVRRLWALRPENGFGRILDVGCGNGLFFDKLGQLGEPEGVEPLAEIVTDEAKRSGRIHVCAFDSSFSPGHRYGLILMLDVLEHLHDPHSAVMHASSLLHVGGFLVINVPAFNCLWTAHDSFDHHLRRYRKSSLRDVLQPSGLIEIYCHYYFHWLFPLKLSVRAMERFPWAKKEATMAAVPGNAVNASMHAACRIEQTLFDRLPLPFGSSLFAIFRSQDSVSGRAEQPDVSS